MYCLNRDNVVIYVKLTLTTSLGGHNPFIFYDTIPLRSPPSNLRLDHTSKVFVFVYYIAEDRHMNPTVAFGFIPRYREGRN